jgi:hypothetical protein
MWIDTKSGDTVPGQALQVDMYGHSENADVDVLVQYGANEDIPTPDPDLVS